MNAFVRTPRTSEAIEWPASDGVARRGWIELGLGAIALIAAIALVAIGGLNRSLQADVATAQAKIASAQTASNVNNNLIRLLAKAAAEKNDAGIRDLLAKNGITYSAAAPAASASEQGAKP